MSRILVVEDHAGMRETLQTMLQQMGHEVVVAGNGREALARQEESPMALLLTDLFMPEMDGLELIQLVHKKYPRVKIVAFTGGPARGGPVTNYVEMARKFGAQQVLIKPFTVDELGMVLKAVGLEPPPSGRPHP